MEKRTSMGGVYRLLEWLMWIAYINLLWCVSLIVGVVVFGLFPATVAAFTVVRKMLMKDENFSIIKTFFLTFKQEFIKANALGFVMLIAGYLIFLDFQLIANVPGPINIVLQTGFIFISVAYFVTLLYIFPTYVHFDLKLFHYIKTAFLYGFFSPIMTIAMVIGIILLYYIMIFIPGMIPLLSVSLFTFIVMTCALLAFQRHETKQNTFKELKETEKV